MNILVIGGYGNFGKRLVNNLVQYHQHRITIAGRSRSVAKSFCDTFNTINQSNINHVEINVLKDDLLPILQKLKTNIVINASGPFQHQEEARSPYRIAEACLQLPCHYIDLADAREFVAKFTSTLNEKAIAAGVMLVSGASTVPGLTTAVIDHHLPKFKQLKSIEYSISPGNKTERGQGTVASILSYTGKPFTTLRHGEHHTIYGWQDTERFDYGPPLGKRWLSNCNIPDLDLLPQYYPGLETVSFKAGLEVGILHYGLWILSALTRTGIVNNLSPLAKILTPVSDIFIHLGSDSGGMHVCMKGVDKNDEQLELSWQLVAENGLGPNVPTIAAELIVKRIMEGNIIEGAMPCIGLFSLEAFMGIASRWNIHSKSYESFSDFKKGVKP